MGFLNKIVTQVVDHPLGLLGDPIVDSLSGQAQQEDANEKAMQAWQIANDYNHPKAQVERLVEAGLNPYLVSLSGNTAGVPGLQGGTVSTPMQTALNGASQVISALQGGAQIQATRAQAQASQAAAGASAAQANNLEAQTTINQTKADYEQKNLIADLDYKRAQTALAKQQAKKTSAEADIAQGEADIFGSTGGAKGASAIGSGLKNVAKVVRGLTK